MKYLKAGKYYYRKNNTIIEEIEINEIFYLNGTIYYNSTFCDFSIEKLLKRVNENQYVSYDEKELDLLMSDFYGTVIDGIHLFPNKSCTLYISTENYIGEASVKIHKHYIYGEGASTFNCTYGNDSVVLPKSQIFAHISTAKNSQNIIIKHLDSESERIINIFSLITLTYKQEELVQELEECIKKVNDANILIVKDESTGNYCLVNKEYLEDYCSDYEVPNNFIAIPFDRLSKLNSFKVLNAYDDEFFAVKRK